MKLPFLKNLRDKYEKYSTPIRSKPEDGIVYWREKLVLAVIFVMVRLAAVAYIPSVILAVKADLIDIAIIDTIAYIIIIYLYVKRDLSVNTKSIVLLVILYVLAVFLLFVVGSAGAGYLWLFFLPIIAAIFVKEIYAYFFLGLNIITLFVFGFLRYTGIYSSEALGPFLLDVWVIIVANFVALNAFTVFTVLILIKGLTNTIEKEGEAIVKLKDRTAELIIAKRKAERADSLKSTFLAQMSHEIRTPINTILSFTSLLRDDIKKGNLDDVDDYFLSIEKGSLRVIRTIDLILNMSELQTGTYDVKIEELDLRKDILDSLYMEYSIIAKKQNISLDLDIKSNSDLFVMVDSYTTKQIFANLLDNAIKYSPRGEVRIALTNNDKNIHVDVVDNGIGISEEFQKNLFEPFSQEEIGYTRKFDGTGLGLALVKKYCTVNNADISVKSKKGVGTTMRVSFKKLTDN